jgi:hypothetical protein
MENMMPATIRVTHSGLWREARERVRAYCSKVAEVEVVRTGETFTVRVTDYGQSLRSAANRAALFVQHELRQLFLLD